MKKYDKYKDSGIEWIGQMPEHWEISKLKFEANLVLGKMLEEKEPKGNDGQYTFEYYLKSRNIGMLEVYAEPSKVDKMWFNDKEKQLYELHEGDLVMNEGGDIGKVSRWKNFGYKCYIQNSVHKISPRQSRYNSSYLQYLICHISTTGYFNSIVNVISIAHLTKEKLADTSLLLPPLSEQEAIAAYLDEKTGQIDALMAEKSEQLKDLQTLRTSIITEAVTKGLNPNAPMKDSGIEWIGQVPEGWETRKIKTILEKSNDSMKVGPFGSALSGNDFTDEGYWVYNQRTILDNNFETNTVFISKEKFDEMQGFAVKAGDFLVTTRGTIGKVVIVPEQHQPGILHPCVIRFRIDNKQVYPTYLRYIFNDSNLISEQVLYNSNSTTIEVIYSYTLKELRIPLPPLSEQRDIAAYLDEKTSEIDAMKAELTAQIEDLKTLRTSLITEAVTGQVDVRDWKTKH